jgi:hypothetical protein
LSSPSAPNCGGAIGAYMDSQKKDLENHLRKEIQAGSAGVDKMPNALCLDANSRPRTRVFRDLPRIQLV